MREKMDTRLSTARAGSAALQRVEYRRASVWLSASNSTTLLAQLRGQSHQDVGDEVALRVDDHHAATGFGVVQDHAAPSVRDLPEPVAPRMWRWWRASATCSPTGRGCPVSAMPEGFDLVAGAGEAGRGWYCFRAGPLEAGG